MCCFYSVCLLSGANGVCRLKCYGGNHGFCNGGLVSAFPFAFVITFLKCYCQSSFCFGHLCDSKNIYGITSVKYCYVLSPMWIEKKSLANSQMGNINLLCHLYELKKNHLWANKCACFISFFILHESKKPIVGLQNVQDPFNYSHVWVEKVICELASVQYHFIFSLLWVKKPCVNSQMCNIILSSPMWIKKIICKFISVKNIFLYSITWAHKYATLFFFSSLICK